MLKHTLMNTEGIHMYAKAYINEHYYKGDTTMLDNLFNVTKAVNVQIAKDAEFYKFVANCFFRFNAKDWGDVQSDSIELNNADPKSALGIYNNLKGKKVWIQSVDYENYTVQTAMFPSDY